MTARFTWSHRPLGLPQTRTGVQSPASAHFARSQWDGPTGLPGCSPAPHPVMGRGALPRVHSSNLETLAPKGLLPWGLPPGIPSAFQLVSVREASQSGAPSRCQPPARSSGSRKLGSSTCGTKSHLQQELPTDLWVSLSEARPQGVPLLAAGTRPPGCPFPPCSLQEKACWLYLPS